MASSELAAAQDQMVLLGRKSASEKVASFLLQLSHRQAARGMPSDPVLLPMGRARSEEHTSELQSLMRISYAVFCLKKKKSTLTATQHQTRHPQRHTTHSN